MWLLFKFVRKVCFLGEAVVTIKVFPVAEETN